MASKFGNIVQAKAEMSMTKEQLEEEKKEYIQTVRAKWHPDNAPSELEAMVKWVKEMHKYISKVEMNMYDCEERLKTQEYDLKELNERQRQVARSKAKAKGLDPDEVAGGKPPKVQVIARGERQIDRRNYTERRRVFSKARDAIPHFPNVPPPEREMERIIKSEKAEDSDEDED